MKSTKNLIIRLFVLTAIMLGGVSLQAAAETELERYTDVRIISQRTAIHPGDEITLATEVNLAPHWHVYWQNPGDSGLPVKVTWDLPDGFEIEDINWPTPDKISFDILVNYGYYNQAILLQKLKIPATLPEGKITLTANLEMLVCNEICIPENDTISIDLNDPKNLDVNNDQYIQSAFDKIAEEIKGEFYYTEETENLKLSLKPEDRTLLNNATNDNLEFFPWDWGIIDHVSMPNVEIKDGHIIITHARGDQPLNEINEVKGLLVIKGEVGENKGFKITALPADNASPPSLTVNQANTAPAPQNTTKTTGTDQKKNVKTDKITWFSALYLALFGGVILNLMPCVFPVLSMKALSLVKMNEKENKVARTHGIAYTLGIVLSFLLIGGLLLILKEAGTAIGWGFQLQSPIVVTILAYLLFSIGLNLIGFFDFNFGLGNIGQKLTQGHSVASSFFTGMLATIVATPCTAPFMGAAMGFAITQPAIISLSVFAMIGFGLALPYLMLSFIPVTRKILPKPGAWMNTFKQFLAFPMLASAIWLIWVLSQQSGSYGVLLVLLGMLSISFSVWISHLKNTGTAKTIARTAMISSLLMPFISLSYIKSSTNNTAPLSNTGNGAFGVPFTQENLSETLKGDDPIFVEMTAAWCITCKINHSIAINIESTKALFKEKNIRYLIGDWTNSNVEITVYLDSFGRNGVPLYVFYGARNKITGKRPEPQILPQVLTPSIVKETIEK